MPTACRQRADSVPKIKVFVQALITQAVRLRQVGRPATQIVAALPRACMNDSVAADIGETWTISALINMNEFRVHTMTTLPPP